MCSGGLYGTYTYICVDMCTNVPREARGGFQCPLTFLSVILRQNLSLNLEEYTHAYINFRLYI